MYSKVEDISERDLINLIGASTDLPLPTTFEGRDIAPGSKLKHWDTGVVYEWNGSEWQWDGSTKELDHNRTELGRGHSYQIYASKPVPAGEVLVVRFQVGDVNYHHAERRILKVFSNTCNFLIARGYDAATLATMTVDAVAIPINQKGLTVGGAKATFTSYQTIDAATLGNLLAGATILDGDIVYGDTSFFGGDTGGESPIIEGRHYIPNDDLLLVVMNSPGNAATVAYKYNWHEA